jgi:hypothetical protein
MKRTKVERLKATAPRTLEGGRVEKLGMDKGKKQTI